MRADKRPGEACRACDHHTRCLPNLCDPWLRPPCQKQCGEEGRPHSPPPTGCLAARCCPVIAPVNAAWTQRVAAPALRACGAAAGTGAGSLAARRQRRRPSALLRLAEAPCTQLGGAEMRQSVLFVPSPVCHSLMLGNPQGGRGRGASGETAGRAGPSACATLCWSPAWACCQCGCAGWA